MTAHSENAFETFEHAGLTVEIVGDDEARSRGDLGDNLGTIVSPDFGDEPMARYASAEDVAEIIRDLRREGCTVVPIREDDYGSSGARIHEADTDDANGYVYVSAAKLLEEYGDTGRKSRTSARRVLRGEIAEWDAVLQGYVFGYVVRDDSGDVLDSCWGFVETDPWGKDAYVFEAGREAAESCRFDIDRERREVAAWAARDVVTV